MGSVGGSRIRGLLGLLFRVREGVGFSAASLGSSISPSRSAPSSGVGGEEPEPESEGGEVEKEGEAYKDGKKIIREPRELVKTRDDKLHVASLGQWRL